MAPAAGAAVGVATWSAPARRSPRFLVAAGAAGLVWLAGEGLLIIHRGWNYAWLAGLFGERPSQSAMGWGAALYALACLMLLAYGLARLGACKGDVFVTGSLLLVIALIALFVFYPVLCILSSAVRDNEGAFAPGGFLTKLLSPSIWSLGGLAGAHGCGVAWNTVAEAALVGLLTTLLGLAFALVALRTHAPMKPLLRALSTLPIITPPFVIGLALILLFGRAGVVTVWIGNLLDIPRSRWIYGMPGITIAQVLAFTPISLMVLLGVLQGVAPSLEEASQTLRASRCDRLHLRNMPVGIRAGLANLSQIDRSLDEASLTLGSHSFGTLIRVILPMLRPAVVTAMVYSFVRAVTAVSAVIFLVTGHYNLATVYTVGRADVGEYGVAIVYSAMLVIFMMLVLILIQLLVGERRIGRRAAAPAVEASDIALVQT